MLCVECYHDNPEGISFCEKCGYPLTPQDKEEAPKTELLADRYRIISPLTEGGTGSVHLGYDIRLNKVCAIKELFKKRLEEMSKIEYEASISLFKKEVELLANLRHPNIPCVTDYFIENERYYLVMDYIDGKDLELTLDEEGAVSEKQVIEWAIQICRILEYLHSQFPPIIHGDIKPANLIIRKTDGAIILVDFGSASAATSKKTLDTSYGTEGYAAPEQYLGKLDARCDIYSLGVTLYELLTGNLPETAFEFGPLREARPDLPISEDIDNIVSKSVNFKPELRYESAKKLKQDLLTAYNKKYSSIVSQYKTNTLIMAHPEMIVPPHKEEKKTIKVMVVDDEETMRDSLREITSYFNDIKLVAEASSGEEALHIFSNLKEKPDIILMDINLPQISGIEVTQKIMPLCPDLKVIMFSAYLDEHKFISSFNAGATGYIYKIGTSWKELEDSIRKAFDGGHPISSSANSLFVDLIKSKKIFDTITPCTSDKEVIEISSVNIKEEEELVFPSKRITGKEEQEKSEELLEEVIDNEFEHIIEEEVIEVIEETDKEEVIEVIEETGEKIETEIEPLPVATEETKETVKGKKEIESDFLHRTDASSEFITSTLCPLCNISSNRPGAKFCKECGQKLSGEDFLLSQQYLQLTEKFLQFASLNSLIIEIQQNKDRLDEGFFRYLDKKMEIFSKKENSELINSMSYLYKIMDNLHIRKTVAVEPAKPAVTTIRPVKNQEESEKEEIRKKKKFGPVDSGRLRADSGRLKKKSDDSWKPARITPGDRGSKRISATEYRKYVDIIQALRQIVATKSPEFLYDTIEEKKEELDEKFTTVLKRQIDFAMAENDNAQ
ncbi:MAG: protein kinase, partial [Candidatus Eremiobacterota bacterium]